MENHDSIFLEEVAPDKPRGVRLLPRYPFRITHLAESETDLKRFVQVFQSTWRRIPIYARRELLKYWRELPGYPSYPFRFSIVNDVIKAGRDAEALGAVNSRFEEIEFLCDAVNIMPDDILSTLIAHELCHIVHRIQWKKETPEDFLEGLIVNADLEPLPEDAPNPYSNPATWQWGEEHEVRETQDHWGFNEEEFCEWLDGNRARLEQMKAAREAEIAKWIEENPYIRARAAMLKRTSQMNSVSSARRY